MIPVEGGLYWFRWYSSKPSYTTYRIRHVRSRD